eukprot:TRINITY_DN11673_c0_g1_i1.p1 TRINITY_DN11673_c0_g1~~TRINITY_DN11673_c0_g1_i1.p1  ORF type:complete len:183 (+),score=38.17 TRINITY_DN11673_c0_g1_i1:229-777(+)
MERVLSKDFAYRAKFDQLYAYLLELAKFDASNHVRAVQNLLVSTPTIAEGQPEFAKILSSEASIATSEESAPAASVKDKIKVDSLSYLLDTPREDCQLLPSEEEYVKTDTKQLREPSAQDGEELASPKQEPIYILPERQQPPAGRVVLSVNEPTQAKQNEQEEQPKKFEHLKNILDDFFDKE